MKYSNVIDVPRPPGSEDLLGVDRYVEALSQFILVARMPTTMAIQGEWGSGKTSLMNQVRYKLCEMSTDEESNKPYYGIWINTWQYAMMRNAEDTLINVIQGVTAEVLDIMQRHKSSLSGAMSKVGGLFGKMAKIGAKAAVSAAGADASVVDDLMGGGGGQSGAAAFRKALSDAIISCLDEDVKAGKPKKGFVFFIDDLDRLDPPIAVQILELLKNLFEVENCIFVLAIDYDVVVKGLVPKFGPLTEKNEREFRSFFDKIIQLPFSMPVNNYKIDTYLADSLNEIGYLTPEEMNQTMEGDSTPVLEYVSEMALFSTGSNPRSVKRLINSLSLIKIMYSITDSSGTMSTRDKLLNFGFVCVQIAYPVVYDMLLFDQNFKEWGERTARRFRAVELDEHMQEQLAEMEEFDDPWEQVLYRVCKNNSYLSAKVYNISRLLNMLAKIIDVQDNFGEEVSRIMSFAAVTTVSNAEDAKNVLSDRNQQAMNIWEDFWDVALKNEEFAKEFSRKKENPYTWIYLPMGVSGCSMAIDQIRKNNTMQVGLYIGNDKKLFHKLFKKKDDIEQLYGGELDWRELPKKKASRVCLVIPFDFNDSSQWGQKFAWIAETLVKMRKAFCKYL